jgi:hypothetical protein
MTIRSIADLPFLERDPLDLLALDIHDQLHDDLRGQPAGPDLDYYGYGYARVDELWLTCEEDPEPLPPVRDALLLGLHAAEDSEPLAGDILLEFWIDGAGEDGEDLAITALLSRFLEIWLPRVSSDERAIVLALCNPQRATIARPLLPGGQPIFYAAGDVTSWLDVPEDPSEPAMLRLTAGAWRKA